MAGIIRQFAPDNALNRSLREIGGFRSKTTESLENIRLFTTPEVAKILKIHRKTVCQLVKRRRLRAVQLGDYRGGMYRFKESDILEFLNRTK